MAKRVENKIWPGEEDQNFDTNLKHHKMRITGQYSIHNVYDWSKIRLNYRKNGTVKLVERINR